MHIDNIKLINFRLFESLHFSPSSKANVIIGANATGKTSLLESIYLLARNRSFRTKNNVSLINKNAQELIISANLIKDCGTNFHLGLKKTKSQTELHIAGQKQRRVSDQARLIPLGIVTANIQRLFTDGPNIRRKFINWGVFHVEHEYATIMNTYNKILMQRNTALRSGKGFYKVWDIQFVEYGNIIDQLRKNYFKHFQCIFKKLIKNYDSFADIEIQYKQGWNKEKKLIEAIKGKNDSHLQYTASGPHRADIGIYINNNSAVEVLSNGQLKILSILFVIAQLILIQQFTNERPIVLFDDIASEIDEENKRRILQLIISLDYQSFITTLDNDFNRNEMLESQVFHVEHGEIF